MSSLASCPQYKQMFFFETRRQAIKSWKDSKRRGLFTKRQEHIDGCLRINLTRSKLGAWKVCVIWGIRIMLCLQSEGTPNARRFDRPSPLRCVKVVSAQFGFAGCHLRFIGLNLCTDSRWFGEIERSPIHALQFTVGN